MPKDTFFNLPDDKRELICKVAIAEFAEYPFDQASVNRIVANAGIAKGSFYQYFEDKADLFLYLARLAGEAKAQYISPVMRNPEEHDFFTLLRELYVSGIQFAAEHPEYAEINKNLLENKASPLYRELMAENLPSAYEFFERMLENAVAKGEVRADIDTKMLAYMLVPMNAHVVEYYVEHIAGEYDEWMLETLDQFVDLLRNGIGRGE
jgi:AcrR family transcriptional regulator